MKEMRMTVPTDRVGATNKLNFLYNDQDDHDHFTMESNVESNAYSNSQPFVITRFTSRTGPLTKVFFKTDDGFDSEAKACLYDGYAESIALSSLSALPGFIRGLTSYQAIGLGTLNKAIVAIGYKVEICTKNNRRPGAVTRTRDNLDWALGPQLICLDYDPQSGTKAFSPQEIRTRLVQYDRSFADVGMVFFGSMSAGVRRIEDPETGERRGGLHIYFLVTSGIDVDALKERLEAMSWLNGDGYAKVSESGGLLSRCLFDLSVFDPSRLFFEAEPILGPGLIKPDREVVFFDGGMLDVEFLKLRETDLDRVKGLIEGAKQMKAEAAGIQRKAYLKKVESDLIRKGVPSKVAREQVKRMGDSAIYPGHTLILG
jgi:hypothetical protein